MNKKEGVIKYRLDFELADPVNENLQQLNAWRSILYGLQLIGQVAARYGGYGYGNLSVRSTGKPSGFIISGSQTGYISELNQTHYVLVEQCDLENNQVVAKGPIQPSSEALTHAILYHSDPSIQCVMHVHDPVLWQYGLKEDLPRTDESISYGTTEMATEVKQLMKSGILNNNGTLIMAGHEDGIICFGDSIDQAGQRLLRLWTQALSV